MRVEKLDAKFDKLFTNLSNENFLSRQALGGEIPFYITPYNPNQHNDVVAKIKQLKDRLSRNGISVLEINLFDLSITLLKERGILDSVIDKESKLGKDKLFKTLQAVLDSETKLVPYISNLNNDNKTQILFLTGVGQLFPFIRSHTILNNLQNAIKDRPTVMFFPGVYSTDLSLFGMLKDDNYYRAFNLDTLNL